MEENKMASDKMKEMIEKLKKPKAEKPKAEEPVQPSTQEVPTTPPVEPPKEVPTEEKKLTEEEVQQLIAKRIARVRDVGVFRLELLGELRGITESINLLNEILGKLLE